MNIRERLKRNSLYKRNVSNRRDRSNTGDYCDVVLLFDGFEGKEDEALMQFENDVYDTLTDFVYDENSLSASGKHKSNKVECVLGGKLFEPYYLNVNAFCKKQYLFHQYEVLEEFYESVKQFVTNNELIRTHLRSIECNIRRWNYSKNDGIEVITKKIDEETFESVPVDK